MNALLDAPPHEAETVDLCHDDVGGARKACQTSRNKGRSGLRRLKVIVQTIDSRYDDINERIGRRYGFQWLRIDVTAAEAGFMKFLAGLQRFCARLMPPS